MVTCGVGVRRVWDRKERSGPSQTGVTGPWEGQDVAETVGSQCVAKTPKYQETPWTFRGSD